MILTLAWRSLLARPVRSAVLAGGFGLGVAVMAALLGIGAIVLEQARAPALLGGGDVVIGGASGRVPSARFVLTHVLGAEPFAGRIAAASPTARANLYLLHDGGATAVVARGGIPSLERALGDRETAAAEKWVDTDADRAWSAPDPGDVLRAMDRFHQIPDVPQRARSWAEWLYFNGRSGDTRFYLTFLAGPRESNGMRTLGVRLQLERDGRLEAFSEAVDLPAAALAAAPDLTAGANRVRLVGLEYRISLDLPAEAGRSRATGDLVVRAIPGRAIPPFSIRGSRGWVSGYVVPVTTGELDGELRVNGVAFDLQGGSAYHDHNWGFWEGVRWQWGQVQAGAFSFVYGRVFPPADAAEADRLPGFLVALDQAAPAGFATDVTIEETNEADGRPRSIVVRGRSDVIDLRLEFSADQSTTTRLGERGFGAGMDFLQLRGRYRVTGRVADRLVDVTAPGSAETFRSR